MLVVSCCICYTWFLMRSTYSCNIEYIRKDQGLALDRFMNGSEKMDKHSGILWGLSPYIQTMNEMKRLTSDVFFCSVRQAQSPHAQAALTFFLYIGFMLTVIICNYWLTQKFAVSSFFPYETCGKVYPPRVAYRAAKRAAPPPSSCCCIALPCLFFHHPKPAKFHMTRNGWHSKHPKVGGYTDIPGTFWIYRICIYNHLHLWVMTQTKDTAIGPVLAVLAHFSGVVDPKHSESRLQDVFEVQSDLSKPSCSSFKTSCMS